MSPHIQSAIAFHTSEARAWLKAADMGEPGQHDKVQVAATLANAHANMARFLLEATDTEAESVVAEIVRQE